MTHEKLQYSTNKEKDEICKLENGSVNNVINVIKINSFNCFICKEICSTLLSGLQDKDTLHFDE